MSAKATTQASQHAAIVQRNQNAIRAAMAAHGTPPQAAPTVAPATAAAAPVTAQPYDPSFAQAQATANRNIAISQGESAYQSGNLGFDSGYNPDGTVNTANPYSRAALYQLSHDNSARGNTNSFAAQGQLYAGSLINAQNSNDSTYARNDAANRLAASRGYHSIQTGQLNTAANNSLGVSDADFNALLKSTYPGS